MKVSIWQQWASNHSAEFIVVGVFETAESAQHAASEIKRLLTMLTDYYSEHEHGLVEDDKGTPLEIAFAKQYQIPAEHWPGIDWIDEDSDVEDAVQTLGRMVSVENSDETHSGMEPFNRLLERLGGQVFFTTEDEGEIVVNLMCTAPDDAVANRIYDVFTRFFQTYDEKILSSLGDFPAMYEETFDGSITRKGRQIRLNDMLLMFPNCAELARLVAVFESLGCTDIEYSLEQGE
jgi:hypothetical protein